MKGARRAKRDNRKEASQERKDGAGPLNDANGLELARRERRRHGFVFLVGERERV